MAKIKKRSSKTQTGTGEEIRSIAHHVSERYQARKQQVNTVLLIVVIIVAVAAIFGFVRSGQEKSAGILLETAYASLSGSGGSGPNYDKALQGFQEVVKQYGSTLNSAIAQLSIGNTLVQMGRTEEAMKAYIECTQRYGGKKLVAAQAYQRLGYLYGNMGRRDDAIAAFKQAEALSGTGIATLELGHLFERAGNSKEALEKYKDLVDKLPGTTLAMSVRSKLPPPDIATPKSATAGTTAK